MPPFEKHKNLTIIPSLLTHSETVGIKRKQLGYLMFSKYKVIIEKAL